MTPDYRALCAELLAAWQKGDDIVGPMNRARALLGQPEPGGPTNDGLVEALKRLLMWPQPSTEAACEQDYTFARAVLDRWGHQPAPPAEGEVAELVEWLRRICFDVAPCDADAITRAADLLEAHAHALPLPPRGHQ